MKCVTFVSEIFTRYGSNITNVWQEIFTPMTLAFSCEVVHEKLWKSVNICKSYGKKISRTFFSGHGVYAVFLDTDNEIVCGTWNYLQRSLKVTGEGTSKGVFIATQLNSTRRRVNCCRHVHSVNNCHLSMNVVTQLTEFVGHDVINKNTTDLAVRCSTGSVELSSVVSL